MMRGAARVLAWSGFLALAPVIAPCAPTSDEPLAAHVVILANGDDPDSLRIAQHYASARAVPQRNVIALKLPQGETIGWHEFVAALWRPLTEELLRERWIDAIPMQTTDALGRRKLAVHDHRIAALVVCRGVPLKIAHDAALSGEASPFTVRGEFRTNAGAVDAELSLLAAPNYAINAFVPNPLFQNERPAEARRNVVIVGRLDGPTAADAMGLVDRAIEAERTGVLGRAYVDLAGRDPLGDEWLTEAARHLDELGFETTVDRDGPTFPLTARFDAPVLYFGWYAGDLNGPFSLPGFQFPAGAIALHIHSYSAASLRTTSQGWTAPFVARGVTATVGNVNEPFLQFTHRPHLLLRALARGATLGEAAYYSLNVLSWQAVLIGDPLYRPFAVSLDEQMRRRASLPPERAAYATLRRMRELEAQGRRDEANALARGAQRDAPSLAVGLALASRLRERGDSAAAADALEFAANVKAFRADEWALAAEVARMLAASGRAESAVPLWQKLLALDSLPREARVAWLREAESAGRVAGADGLARRWAAELAALTAPAEKK